MFSKSTWRKIHQVKIILAFGKGLVELLSLSNRRVESLGKITALHITESSINANLQKQQTNISPVVSI
jgi:hypothetical protein